MEDKEYRIRRNNLYKLSHTIRGSILDQTIFIERFIENIISWHFCPDASRHDLFFTLILNHRDLRFSSKIEMLEELLKCCYPNLMKKYPGLIKKLNSLRNLRNALSHSMLDNSKEFLSKQHSDRIQLRWFEDGRWKQRVITNDIFMKEMKNCHDILQILFDIYDVIKSKIKDA